MKKLPKNPLLKNFARKLRNESTLSEVLFWNAIKNKKILNLDFDRQKVIGNYIVDFYCSSLKLVIEIDGWTHDKKQDYDKTRDKYFLSLGLHVLHIHDIDVKQDINNVMQMVRNYCETIKNSRD